MGTGYSIIIFNGPALESLNLKPPLVMLLGASHDALFLCLLNITRGLSNVRELI